MYYMYNSKYFTREECGVLQSGLITYQKTYLFADI